ncbi:hypothetical protein [Nocardia sp. NRRL S-836]|uniref:hypothetical protein n=1 Tax=Nocardia sp. NRRL S-836 TaxID=1519492 RepID=UPI0006AE49ED|nr:hypothetical protein [Nocardia sp. NRRL S-836]KOV89691.1 hypothetical protein ADL03_02375 [Nocardia sp. NRRL S-836]
MRGFEVDPAELRTLAGPLVRAAGEVAEQVAHPDGEVDGRRGGLFAALDRFRGAAGHAVEVLGRDAEQTAHRLADTARRYEEADSYPA